MSPFSPGYTASGTINYLDRASITYCPSHHSLYHLISGWSSKVLSLPNKVISALFWTLRNSSNATKTTLVLELVHHALSLYSIWTYWELKPKTYPSSLPGFCPVVCRQK